jgi:hypothetical protein
MALPTNPHVDAIDTIGDGFSTREIEALIPGLQIKTI